MKPINYADLIDKARREGKGLYADFVIALEEALTEIEMQRGQIERLEAVRPEALAIENAYANGWETALETAAQHVENQHVVWDQTEIPPSTLLDMIAKNIRAIHDWPSAKRRPDMNKDGR